MKNIENHWKSKNVMLATVTSAHATSIIKTTGYILKYLWDGPKW